MAARITKAELLAINEELGARIQELKADMHRIDRRLEFLDRHVTAQNVRSLTIRLGQMETNLTAIRDSVNVAILGLRGTSK